MFSYLPFASVICWTKWQSIWRDQCNRRVSGREQARPMPMQEAEIGWKKVSFVRCYVCCASSGHSKDNSRSPLTVLVRWVAGKGRLCFTPSSRVAWLARAPSLHVNRPLNNTAYPLFFPLTKQQQKKHLNNYNLDLFKILMKPWFLKPIICTNVLQTKQ